MVRRAGASAKQKRPRAELSLNDDVGAKQLGKQPIRNQLKNLQGQTPLDP